MADWLRKERKKTQSTNMRNESGDIVTDSADIKRIIRPNFILIHATS